MPDVAFVEIDSLDLAQGANPVDELRAVIEKNLHGAAAVVAHGLAAGAAIEAVSNVDPDIGLLLLSPQYVKRGKPAAKIVQAFLRQHAMKRLLTTVARAKHRKLLRDPLYVRAQLRTMVRAESALDAGLVQEARERIADPRMLAAVENTADTVLAVLRPIDPAAEENTRNRVGRGPGLALLPDAGVSGRRRRRAPNVATLGHTFVVGCKRRRCVDPENFAPLAQLVEHRTFNPLVPGSIPGGRTNSLPKKRQRAPLAQLVEQVTLNHLVEGSSPPRCKI